MARRILFLLAVVVFPVSLFAQNDIGVWLNTNHYKTTTETDPTLPDATFKFKVDQRVGYGISFNHFSGPNVSTEFAFHQIKGDAKAEVISPNPTFRAQVDVGAFKANVLSAVLKWNFMPHSFITPYVGGGLAYFTGGQAKLAPDVQGAPADTVKFKNKTNFVLDGGVNFSVARSIAIGADLRYSPYSAADKSDPTSPAVKLNPVTLALGVRFRM